MYLLILLTYTCFLDTQGFLPNFSETVPKAPLRRSRTSLAGSDREISMTLDSRRPSWAVGGGGGNSSGAPTPPLRRSRMSLTTDADTEERPMATIKTGGTPPVRPPPPTSVTVGYATVDKSASLLVPPQSPARHRRKKSYDVIKSQEFGAFFTIPRSYSYNRTKQVNEESVTVAKLPPPSRPARAYNTLGPSRPVRRRLSVREHEYGDVVDGSASGAATTTTSRDTDDGKRPLLTTTPRSTSLEDGNYNNTSTIEKIQLRPLPSPPAPPRKSKTANDLPEPHRRRNTDSALVPFLDRRETSATSSDDFFADVSRALLASAAKNTVTVTTADDVSIGVQTDPLPDGYELDDLGSCCSAESDRPTSRASSTFADRPTSRLSTAATDRPTSRTSMTTEYVDRPTSRISTTAVENGYVMLPEVTAAGVICAQRISVNELQVGKMTVADLRSQRMGVDDMSGSNLKIAHLVAAGIMMPPSLESAATSAVLPPCDPLHPLQDDAESVQSSRVSSMYPEVDSDEDRTSVMAVPTPPRRRSKPAGSSGGVTRSSSIKYSNKHQDDNGPSNVDLSVATAVDPSITELSCQLFRLCHSNVCSLFNKVIQQVVPEDTEKRRDLQAALCFLSIILAGLLILGFGNEKTIHHHHWDFQFPPPN